MADLIASTRPFVTTDDTTADEIAEGLTHLNWTAKRQQCLVGNDDYQTPWDLAHRCMDAPLDDWLEKTGRSRGPAA